MPYDIFISYSRKDTIVAEKVLAVLEKAGFRCFIDRAGISGGADFPAILAQAILDSRLVLMLASKNAYRSEYTRKELVFTVNNRGSQCIFPLIIDGSVFPKDLEFMLSNINWRILSDEYRIEKELIDDLRHRLDHTGEERTEKASENVKKRRPGKKVLLAAACVIFFCVVTLSLLRTRNDRRLSQEAETARAEFVCSLDSVNRCFSRADSLRDLGRPEELFRQEVDALFAAHDWLEKADSVRSAFSGNPYVVFDGDRYDLLSGRKTAKTDSLFSVWKPYALRNWSAWLRSKDPVDYSIAKQSVANARVLHPEDAELLRRSLRRRLSIRDTSPLKHNTPENSTKLPSIHSRRPSRVWASPRSRWTGRTF